MSREKMREITLATICLLGCAGISFAAPGQSADEVLIRLGDAAVRNKSNATIEKVRPTKRPKTTSDVFETRCFVNNKIYTHSQMVPSEDENAHCLCIAGEVYCWYQTPMMVDVTRIPETMAESTHHENIIPDNESNEHVEKLTSEEMDYSIPVKDHGDPDTSDEEKDDLSELNLDELAGEDTGAEIEDVEELSKAARVDEAGQAVLANASSTTSSSESTTASFETPPSTCVVMGRTYQRGELLPRTTGNCVECSCGAEGRIECSPRDCATYGSDGNGPGLEFFDLEHERGISGSAL